MFNSKSRWALLLIPAIFSAVLLLWRWEGGLQKVAPPVDKVDAHDAPNPKSDRPEHSGATANRIATPIINGLAAIPKRFQLPGVQVVKATASSSKEWISAFPSADQKKIIDFNKRHFGIYSINSPQQIAWMAQNDYPMPEDIIAAEALSNQDLRQLAGAGNDKASFILRERDLDALKSTFDTYAMEGKSPSDFWQSDPAAAQMTQDDVLNKQIMQSSNSPFKGYLQAEDSLLSSDPVDAAAKAIGGLLWSESLGDSRAAQFAQTYANLDQLNNAVWMGATLSATNGAASILQMRLNGCTPVGVGVGGAIPGDYAPVE